MLLAFVQGGQAQELSSSSEPVGTGVVFMGYTLMFAAFVLLPMASLWLASHYLMEDDQPKHAVVVYFAFVLIIPLSVVLANLLLELLPNDSSTLVTVSFLGVAGSALSLCLFVTMKTYYANIFRAIGFLLVSAALMGGGLFGMYTALSTLPAGEFAVGKSVEAGRVALPHVEAFKKGWVSELKESRWAFFIPPNWFEELDAELVVDSEPETRDESSPEEPLDWAQSSRYETGDQVELTREVSFDSDFGNITLPVGSVVTIVGPTNTAKRWEVKRGLSKFEVSEADLGEP